jgi:SAM-dependent methyltransferase
LSDQNHWDLDRLLHTKDKTNPKFSDPNYLHATDLNEFLKSCGSNEPLTILDYGAGASPYSQYFPQADYRRADITGSASLQYKIGHDSAIPEADNTFDMVLSTQVAEHVSSPEVYFKEAFRLLKGGGRFVLTTHGLWEEHGSPYDFQRWTGEGLRRDLAKAGFEKITIYKMTCGLRCGFQLFTRALYAASPPTRPLSGIFFKSFRWSYSRLAPLIYRICERWWPQDRIFMVDKKNPGSVWYIIIAAIAEK